MCAFTLCTCVAACRGVRICAYKCEHIHVLVLPDRCVNRRRRLVLGPFQRATRPAKRSRMPCENGRTAATTMLPCGSRSVRGVRTPVACAGRWPRAARAARHPDRLDRVRADHLCRASAVRCVLAYHLDHRGGDTQRRRIIKGLFTHVCFGIVILQTPLLLLRCGMRATSVQNN